MSAFTDLAKGWASLYRGGASSSNVVSPWGSGDSSALKRFAVADIYGADMAERLPLTREQALEVPAVAKARNLLVSTLAPLPLRALNVEGAVASQPTFLYRTDGQNPADTPFNRTAAIVDDLLFFGVSLLAVERGAQGQVLHMAHVPMSRWDVYNGLIRVDQRPVQDNEIVLINGPYEGLLAIGQSTLRGARDIELAWQARARNPIPLVVLRDTSTTSAGGLLPEEIEQYLTSYKAALRESDGSVIYSPPGTEVSALGQAETSLFESGRNAAVTSIGQLVGIRSSMLDGTLADSASLTYTTTQGERSAFLTHDLPLYSAAIEARLSADDVVPAGSRVRFDMSELLINPPTPTGAVTED